MGLAADRDRIAAAYVTDYVEVFEFGLRVLAQCARAYGRSEPRRHHAAHGLPCHISRTVTSPASTVAAVAEAVREEARALVHVWQPVAQRNTLAKLLDFDAELKRRER